MDKISLPIDSMKTTAKTISSYTQDLIDEMTPFRNHIESIIAELPSSMHSTFDSFLESFNQDMHKVLTLRQDIGWTLKVAADAAEQTENHINNDIITSFQVKIQ
jgi:uncharacterized protein YukE